MMLSCREATHLLSERLDRPLKMRERLGLRFHLLLCVYCRRFGKHLQALRLFAGTLRASENPPLPDEVRLSPQARERLRKTLGGPPAR